MSNSNPFPHLRLADEVLEEVKGTSDRTFDELLLTKLKWSMILFMVRAVVAALIDIADAVRELK
jgi:hypothetical protein